MESIEELRNAPWFELLRRARESGPQFIFRYLTMLKRQRLPPEQIRQYQERRLERIIRHAATHVPAYRESGGPLHGLSLSKLGEDPVSLLELELV